MQNTVHAPAFLLHALKCATLMDMRHTIPMHTPHRVLFGRDLFHGDTSPLLDTLRPQDPTHRGRLLVLIDQSVVRAQPHLLQQIQAFLETHQQQLPQLAAIRAIPGGEQSKVDLSNLEWLLTEMHNLKLCRRSVILAIGGGAMLDMVGFAAAICHRGIPLVRMPSTTMGQCDSGVGVKNGVNMFGKKNFVGTFAIPRAVVNDLSLLDSLDQRTFVSGLSEALKVALLKDASFFDTLCRNANSLRSREKAVCQHAIMRSAQLHLEHIALGGDPFEHNVARPLDFGHWSAHKLEQLSQFKVLHGEAVGIGIVLDLLYGVRIGITPHALALKTAHALNAIGLPLWHPCMENADQLLEGLEEFREHLGGQLTLTLITEPGKPLDIHSCKRATLVESLCELQTLAASLKTVSNKNQANKA